MLTTIGILLIIVGIVILILKSLLTTNQFLKSITRARSIQMVILGAIMSITTGTYFYANAGIT